MEVPRLGRNLILEIRLATTADLEPVVSLVRETSKWLKTKGIHQWSENFPLSTLEAEVAERALHVVLDGQQKIIGTVVLSRNSGHLWPADSASAVYLNRMVIAREFKGRSLGVKMIDWAKSCTRQQNIELLRLSCDKANPFLPGFYRRCGFVLIGEFFYAPWNMTFNLYEVKL